MNYDEFDAEGTTTDTLETVGGLTWEKRYTKSGSIVAENTGGTNTAVVKIVASPVLAGDNFLIELQGETDVAPGGSIYVAFNDYFPRIRVLAKSKTSGNATDVHVSGSAVGI